MEKYINGGIVREMTITLKRVGDMNLALEKLGEYLDLNLYDMKIVDNMIYLELCDDFLKEHLASFLEELANLQILPEVDYMKKIAYIKEHYEEDIDTLLENCDDLFQERFRTHDTYSINDSSFYLDTLCNVFYFEGPFEGENFEGLLHSLHILQKSVLKSPLRGALCFGINE